MNPQPTDPLKWILKAAEGKGANLTDGDDLPGPGRGWGWRGVYLLFFDKFDSIPSPFIKHLLYSKHWIQISKVASSFL